MLRSPKDWQTSVSTRGWWKKFQLTDALDRTRRGGREKDRRCTLFVLSTAWSKKKVKINYFVVDARTGRGIDRPLDRIKSRARRLPFPRASFFLFWFLFLFATILTHRFCFALFRTADDTQRKMITSRRKGRGGSGYLAGQSSPSDVSPVEKGIYRDVEERVDISKVLAKVERAGLLFSHQIYILKWNLTISIVKKLLRNYDKRL